MSEFLALVSCPKCDYRQKTTTIRRVKCFSCGHSYTVMPILSSRPARFKPRIVRVLKGSSLNEYWREKNRRYFQRKERGGKNQK